MEIMKLIKIKRFRKINEKIFVKIISPNFDLKYGLTKDQIRREI